MKKVMKAASAALLMGFMGGAVAQAEGEWSGNVALTTDYVWRGVTQSAGDWAIQGGFDYSNGMFYAGTWASNVDFGDGTDTNMEIDFYGGLAGETDAGLGWDVGVIYYAYPDSSDTDLDFTEVYGALSYGLTEQFGVGGSVNWDPDNQNVFIEANAALAISDMFSVDGQVGNYSFDGGDDYTMFALGATTSFEGFDLDFRFWSNDIETAGLASTDADLLDDRFVVTLSRSM